MSDLLKKKCIPCEGGVIPFDISKIHEYQKKVDGWDITKNEKNIYFLENKFTFKNFLESQKFVNEIGVISEREGHHPDISFGWGYAKISITTHAIEGLSENDFILAAKVDEKIKIIFVAFANLMISLSLIDPAGWIIAVIPD